MSESIVTLQKPEADRVAPAGPPFVADYANVSNAASGVWRDTTLGDFVSLRRGHDLTEVARRPGTVPVFGSAGPNGFHDTALVKGPGVVVGRSGASFGQAHYSESDYWPHNTVLYVTDFHGNDPLFCYYFLRSIDFSRHNSGGAQQSLNRNFISSIPIRVPEPDEQRVIATAFADVDHLLAALDALIAKKQAIKTAAMQQLLTGKRRLPGFSGQWEERRLGTLASMSSGGTPTSSVAAFYNGGIPWVSIADMTRQGKFISSTERTISTAGLESSAAKMFPAGTVLYAMYASIGECSIAAVPVSSSQAILGIETGKHLDSEYLYHFLWAKKSEVIALGQQGTQANLNAGMVRDFIVALPSIDEQRAIATVFSDMDAEIDALKARWDKTIAIKQGMMQELLTGRTRLI